MLTYRNLVLNLDFINYDKKKISTSLLIILSSVKIYPLTNIWKP